MSIRTYRIYGSLGGFPTLCFTWRGEKSDGIARAYEDAEKFNHKEFTSFYAKEIDLVDYEFIGDAFDNDD